MREWSSHSYEKISILGDYLRAFAKASQSAPERVYIDAFAGDTENELRATGESFLGSARLALDVQPPFTKLCLFERDRQRAKAMRRLAVERRSGEVLVYEGDCNTLIPDALTALPQEAPTFAFLDPDGMELEWRTIERIADHKRPFADATGKSKVEIWILFPSKGVTRMLGGNRDEALRSQLPRKVARLYGAWGPWQDVWDARHASDGAEPISGRVALEAYTFLYMDRLASLGYRYLRSRPIRTSKDELYVMVFASDHDAGDRIMKWAERKARVRPREGTLFEMPTEPPDYPGYHTCWRDDFPTVLRDWEEYEWEE